MAIKQYILTIDENAMTDELRAQLETLGAEVQEEPIEELDLPEDEALEMIKHIREAEQGRNFKSWEQVNEEVREYRAKRRVAEQEGQAEEELDPETARAIDEALAASARGEKGRPWGEIRAEIQQRRAARNRQQG